MAPNIEPKRFGLHHSTQLEQSGEKEFTLVIDRKSRIIMKDGQTILAKAAKIRAQVPGAAINLKAEVRGYEAHIITKALRSAAWDRKLAAKNLGIPLRTLAHKIQLYGITKPK